MEKSPIQLLLLALACRSVDIWFFEATHLSPRQVIKKLYFGGPTTGNQRGLSTKNVSASLCLICVDAMAHANRFRKTLLIS